MTTVGVTSVGAVAASLLPGDWGFFTSYLIGGISIAVLGIGSVAPGLLTVGTDFFSRVFPDYRERILRCISSSSIRAKGSCILLVVLVSNLVFFNLFCP